MKKIYVYLLALIAATAIVSCDDENNEQQTGPEEVPDPELPADTSIHFTNAELIYMGDEDAIGTDLWYIKLYTDMEVDELAAPIGPGQLMQISLNTRYAEGSEPDPTAVSGDYVPQASLSEFPVGTFNLGTMNAIPMPDVTLHLPDHTYFGDLSKGSTEYVPDLIERGTISVDYAADGTLSVSGMVAGSRFLKHRFDYKGTPKMVDRSPEIVPNSTLDEDITDLSMLTKTRLWDMGDGFGLGNDSYRLFQIFLAEPTVDLTENLPKGDGRALRLELFVEWSATAGEGIPEGTYTASLRTGGGIDRKDIVPFRIVTGQHDRFLLPSGTWWQTFVNGKWGDTYACIDDGTVTVKRPDGGYEIELDLIDCNDPAHHIKGTWKSSEPLDIYTEPTYSSIESTPSRRLSLK